MADRALKTIEMSQAAYAAINRLCEQTGMLQKVLIGRVLEWFGDLDPIEQLLILNTSMKQRPDVSTLLLRRAVLNLYQDRKGPPNERIDILLDSLKSSTSSSVLGTIRFILEDELLNKPRKRPAS